MRTKLIALFLFALTLSASAQNYKLFNAGSRMVFTEYPVADSSYSLAFDTVTTTGSDSVYFPYCGVDDSYITSENCQFWGPPECSPQIKPIWIGRKILTANGRVYLFFNNQGDTLNFDFGLQTGETSLFYEDAIQRFQLFSEGPDTITSLGMVDSARIYRILHTDLQGNVMNSALNNQEIIIGKYIGLIRFFQVDQFPAVLKPLGILGNSSPESGMFKLTNALIYDHQPGDEIQYNEYHFIPDGPPYENYDRFIKYVYVDREDTQDSIIYLVNRTVFDMGESNEVTTSLTLKYSRNGFIAVVPYDKIYPDYIIHNRYLKIVDYCGLPLWTYSIKPQYLTYCGEENCWGPMDIPGPPPNEETSYVAGLGLYLDESYIFIPNWEYYQGKKITYFKKNGITCGEEAIVGLNNQPLPDYSVNIFPNPAGDKLFIKSAFAIDGTILILNMNGQIVHESMLENSFAEISTENLSQGIYMIKVIWSNGVTVKKFLKQ
ncbi:MAG: T9SS type A sorting domain-containing protein [Bacteroidales bacterium]|nr:T9SS type A sorting domain-containing protein [Bacteroidales bacterium]